MPNEKISRMLGQGFFVQSILFDKRMYTVPQSMNILKQRGYIIPPKVDVTDKYIRFRMHDPQSLNTFHTIDVAKGIKVIMGKKSHSPQVSGLGKTPEERKRLMNATKRKHIRTDMILRSGKTYQGRQALSNGTLQLSSRRLGKTGGFMGR